MGIKKTISARFAVMAVSVVAVAAVAIPVMAGAAGNGDSGEAIQNDQITSAYALNQFQVSQPTPVFKYSQERETLTDIERMQASDTQTTSFGFQMGDPNPVWSCPSIGVPIASTTQLTNPAQSYNAHDNNDNGDDVVVPEVDPTGVYTGDSTGTYVLCVAPNGTNYLQYWEGFVDAITGPAVWSTATGTITLTGPSTVNVKVKHSVDQQSLKKGKK